MSLQSLDFRLNSIAHEKAVCHRNRLAYLNCPYQQLKRQKVGLETNRQQAEEGQSP